MSGGLRYALRESSFWRLLKNFPGDGAITTTDASLTTVQTIPIPEDVTMLLRVPIVGQMILFSHFTGANKTDNQGFTAGIGDWVQGTGGTLASTAGGQAGNGGRYTVGGAPSTTLMSLVAGLTNLVVGRQYRLTYYMKYETAWNGGNVTCTIDGQTKVTTPTTSYVEQQLDFEAAATTPTIAFTCASGPTTSDILWIDTFELTELSAGGYVFRGLYQNLGGAINMISTTPTSAFLKEEESAWNAQLNISGTNVLVQVVGEVDTTIKWGSRYERTYVVM